MRRRLDLLSLDALIDLGASLGLSTRVTNSRQTAA